MAIRRSGMPMISGYIASWQTAGYWLHLLSRGHTSKKACYNGRRKYPSWSKIVQCWKYMVLERLARL